MEGFSDWNRLFFIQGFFFFLNFTGVEKTQADTVPQNDFENDAAKGSITGDVVLWFLK